MKLHELTKIKTRSKKRLGRGIGSKKGKTAGRGTKGQKARGKIPATFIGGLPFYKKLPLKKGKGNVTVSSKPAVVNLAQLNKFPAKSIITMESLLESKLISAADFKKGVKILGNGELIHALVVKVSVSNKARKKIEEKGGRIEDV